MKVYNYLMHGEIPKSFLIADDDQEVREAISEAIKHHYKDARVYTAQDGSEAMQKLRNAPPSLVIIDLDMPRVTGVEMIDQMQKANVFARIPIIVISGLDIDSQEVQMVQSRGITFVQKPFKTQYLLGLVEGVFSGEKAKNVNIQPKILKQGDLLFQEGDPSGNVYIVKTGKLRVYKSKSTQTKEIGVIGPNELVGEMAFIDKSPRSATIEAIEETELMELPIDDFQAYLNTQPLWMRSLINTLLARLRTSISIRE